MQCNVECNNLKRPRAYEDHLVPSSPTINTKNAITEISAMFNGPLGEEQDNYFEEKKRNRKKKRLEESSSFQIYQAPESPRHSQSSSFNSFQIHQDENTQPTTITNTPHAPLAPQLSVIHSTNHMFTTPSFINNHQRHSQATTINTSSTISYKSQASTRLNDTITTNQESLMNQCIRLLKSQLDDIVNRSGQDSTIDHFNSHVLQIYSQIITPGLFDEYNDSFVDCTSSPFHTDPNNTFDTPDGHTYTLNGHIGRGAFAIVMNASSSSSSSTLACKIQSPSCPWEFYICKRVQANCPSHAKHLFINPAHMYLYKDTSLLMLPKLKSITLHHLINCYKTRGKYMPELLVMHYAIKLIDMIQILHDECKVIHADIKPDNILVLCDEDWRLQLIDFGRSIDMNLYRPGVRFVGTCHASNFKCIEMTNHEPWSWHVDRYGVCAVVHVMLHNEYMQVKSVGDGRHAPKLNVKRYYQTLLWKHLFDECLNKKDDFDWSRVKRPFEEYMVDQNVSGVLEQQFAMDVYNK
ncbi:mitotic checkpoint serine/threonine-protein kinase BUB1 [Acrasis kona]|uniref:Mitotic checkpoint serine/threonine-protein kinase BUB1 n=1 Tax=Acrasis kona TaxID=1008807 RepID=A0AAW2Z432_9EUKA